MPRSQPPGSGTSAPTGAASSVTPVAAEGARAAHADGRPAGGFTTVDGENAYGIATFDRMPPFLMSLASDTDLWAFVSSAGGLTLGRVDADGALFPYETSDKLHDVHHHTGPRTWLRVRRPRDLDVLWRPFEGDEAGDDARAGRHLYKNTLGNRLWFEEVRDDLELALRYRWAGCDALGFVRTVTLTNRGRDIARIEVLDGLRNVLPYGAPLALYQTSSNLVDAYKRTDYDAGTGLGVFALTSRILDRPEAAEVLRANVAWAHGLPDAAGTLDPRAWEAFGAAAARRQPLRMPVQHVRTGQRGHYLVASAFDLEPGASLKWHLVADAGLDHVQLAALRARLLERAGNSQDPALDRDIESQLDDASRNLRRILASADALQLGGHREATVHHLANVLANVQRGGVFVHGNAVPAPDFAEFVRLRNRDVAARHADTLAALPDEIPASTLRERAAATGDADLERLALEYMPLFFGRRHGDPSRPWNRFAIRVKNADGTRALHYEGNWRDIFQNWEALAWSFPEFLPSCIATFVNASTVDGFNPYRITRAGVDWEVVDPRDPWSHIGYWGDHQIVYLLKFLEALPRFAPGRLEALLHRPLFTYANVPYRIRPYADIVADPRATIDYDEGLADRIAARVEAMGADGKLVPGPDGAPYRVHLFEKLLVPALAKLSNLVPGAGIWMNTQRPEWNDANNALVGNGVSVVTLCYLRRYLRFLARLGESTQPATVELSAEVADWLRRLASALREHRYLLDGDALQDNTRKQLLDALGQAFGDYRAAVYARGFSGKTTVPMAEVRELCAQALAHVDHAIDANRREDGLFHAYVLLRFGNGGRTATIEPLYEMLEGQVAALSSGRVSPAQAVELVAALFSSRLYREDQRSFLLYPERELPAFADRNVVPDAEAGEIALLQRLLDAGDTTLVRRDAAGVLRFAPACSQAGDVTAVLDRLAADEAWRTDVERDRRTVLDLFERVFHHASFTGRSGTMYGYEGLGCVYWHMVGKLLLAVQEVALRALRDGEPARVTDALVQAYHRIRDGLGFCKSATEYGAFPTDPYSHTPRHAGAQQPGMTGQVKEEILTRWGELGVQVEAGCVRFRPRLLQRREFLEKASTFRYYDVTGEARTLDVQARSLAFTFCQVPVVYALKVRGAAPRLRVTRADGTTLEPAGDTLDDALSRSLFQRLGEIARIDVDVPASSL